MIKRIGFFTALMMSACVVFGGVDMRSAGKDTIPASLLGRFVDDYNIGYDITDTMWSQEGGMKYHVLEWNTSAQYVIARNGSGNGKDANKYTRIDYMLFNNMAPWHWGYCFTVYNAASEAAALAAAVADRGNPRKGCNGFPFSRMKRPE